MVMVMVMTMMMLMMVLAKTTHTGWLVLIWRNQSSFTPPSHTFMSQLKQCNTPQNTLQCPELHSILHSCITTHHSALDFVVSRPIRHSTGAAQFCMIFGCADISQNLCNLPPPPPPPPPPPHHLCVQGALRYSHPWESPLAGWRVPLSAPRPTQHTARLHLKTINTTQRTHCQHICIIHCGVYNVDHILHTL